MKPTIKQFFVDTTYQKLSEPDQQKGLPQPPLETPYKGDAKPIDLPKAESIQVKGIDLTEAILQRRSQRDYTEEAMTLAELAYLLWATAGVKQIYEDRATLRTVPSAGARHAFETYLLINNVEGLQPGLYRYLALSHQLVAVNLRDGMKRDIMAATGEQKFVGTSAVTFLWVAVAYRMTYRYSERGYRYLFLDAGHVCENLYLACQAVDCGCCGIAAYGDNEMNYLLGVDGENEFVIYLAPVGKVK